MKNQLDNFCSGSEASFHGCTLKRLSKEIFLKALLAAEDQYYKAFHW